MLAPFLKSQVFSLPTEVDAWRLNLTNSLKLAKIGKSCQNGQHPQKITTFSKSKHLKCHFIAHGQLTKKGTFS